MFYSIEDLVAQERVPFCERINDCNRNGSWRVFS